MQIARTGRGCLNIQKNKYKLNLFFPPCNLSNWHLGKSERIRNEKFLTYLIASKKRVGTLPK